MRKAVSWVTENSYRKSGLVLLAAAMVLLLGLATVTRVKQELIPDIDFPVFTVIAQSAGTPPNELVASTTGRVEDIAATLPGFKSTQSTVVEGLSVTLVNLEFGSSIDDAERTISEALSSAGLPPNVSTSILKFDVAALPVVDLSLAGDLGQAELTELAQATIVPQIRSIDGVAAVDITGGATSEVLITIDRQQLLDSGLRFENVASALRANNVVLPSGTVAAGETNVPLETVSIYRTLDQIEATTITTPAGTQVRLDSIADVEQGEALGTGSTRTNGQPALAISVAKDKEANTVTVAHAITDALDEIEAALPAGASIEVFQDQSEIITESVNGVMIEGVIGGVLAIVVIFVFLANWRTTIITAVSIPLSIISAIIILDGFGYSLNLMTLGGLTIAIGRVIDDSIVVLENVYRHMARGERGFAAIMNGAREVTIAILGATATTCAVFLPLGLVGGLIGQLFLPFAIAVVAALLASLVIAITVIPVLARYALAAHVKVEEERHVRDTLAARVYTPVLRVALANRWKTLGLAGVLFIASLGLVPLLPVSFLGDSGERIVTVNIEARPGQTREAVLSQAVAVEDLLTEFEIDRYQTVITGASTDFGAIGQIVSGKNPNSATITAELTSGGPSKNDVAAALREAIATEIDDGDNISVSASGGGFGSSGISVTVAATTQAALASLPDATAKITDAIAAVEDTANVRNDLASAQRSIEVQVNPSLATAAGLRPADIAGSLRALSSRETVTAVDLGAGLLPVRLLVSGGDTTSLNELGGLEVARGVRLDSVATLSDATKQVSITRVDGRPASTITGDITIEDQGSVSTAVDSAANSVTVADDIEIKLGGVGGDIEQGFADLFFAIGVSIVLVYVIMSLLFKSWIDPMVILASLPLAVIGALVALVVTGSALSISALIGMLMLVGIVVTNAIVLLEFVIMLREERGYSVYDALIEGGQTRLRPILMTAIAAMLALIPLSLGLTEGALIASDLGRTVIGGLFSSTLLTLLVVPVLYSLVNELKQKLANRQAKAVLTNQAVES